MCGLIFIYEQGVEKEELTGRARKALNQMRHRGPDDEGLLLMPSVAIGHRRLSIIDLAASQQPMSDPSGRYVLVYNGEIYNFKELRARLEGKWEFKTQGDTEVLLAGLIIYGEQFLQDMEGMWAFSLWDKKEKKLLLGRDRMGKKPLYYQTTETGFFCASELPSLECLVKQSWSEDMDSTADFLRYGYYLPGTTAYQSVREVLPGHVMYWEPGRVVESTPYWSLSVDRFQGSKQQAQQLLREKMFAAVEKRLVSDVEVGAFLSGGVDSSLIVSIMVNEFGVSPKTFTIGFEEKSYDESMYADQIANECGTEHYVELLTEWDSGALERLIFEHVGQPFSDSSILPTALVSKLASSHVKVALSGDGGDELFSGYQRYQARVLLQWYTRLPTMIRKNIECVIKAIPEPMVHHSRSLIKKAHLFKDAANRQVSETPYIAPLMFSNEDFSKLAPDLVGFGHQPPEIPNESRLDDIQRMMSSDALVYLPQDILLKVDRASMAYSLEARAPFLDSDVVKLAFSMPRYWHRRRFSGKRMLRETFSDLLPDNIWRRRKQGFGVPIHSWFRQQLGSELEVLLEEIDSPLNKEMVRGLLDVHRQGGRDHGYRLWMFYVYLLWRRRSL